jgi:hypoxanthine-guanine phosphoribosyltransferase
LISGAFRGYWLETAILASARKQNQQKEAKPAKFYSLIKKLRASSKRIERNFAGFSYRQAASLGVGIPRAKRTAIFQF